MNKSVEKLVSSSCLTVSASSVSSLAESSSRGDNLVADRRMLYTPLDEVATDAALNWH